LADGVVGGAYGPETDSAAPQPSRLEMFTVNRFTENFRLTGFSINQTETGNMATALSAKNIF